MTIPDGGTADGNVHGTPGPAQQMPQADNPGSPGAVAPYVHGQIKAIDSSGDHDADDADTVRDTPGDARDAANARQQAQSGDASHAGGQVGDTLILPANPLDPGVGSLGTTDPAGAFYDPPREYSTDPNGSGAPVQSFPADDK